MAFFQLHAQSMVEVGERTLNCLCNMFNQCHLLPLTERNINMPHKREELHLSIIPALFTSLNTPTNENLTLVTLRKNPLR